MFPLRTNFCIGVCGNSKSGKTTWTVQLLNNASRLIDKPLHKIYWILGDENAKPQNLNVPVEYVLGIPEEFVNNSGKPCLWVIDDSMFETDKIALARLLVTSSHHSNMSVVFLTQNLFQNNKYSRTISLNFTHLCIMKNPRDKLQFSYLARQLCPDRARELVKIYKEVTEKPYSYLFIDLTQTTPDLFRFRTDIFNPNYATVYCPKIPDKIGDMPVNHARIGKESTYSTSVSRHQM